MIRENNAASVVMHVLHGILFDFIPGQENCKNERLSPPARLAKG